MARPRFAKFNQASQSALARMLHQERVAALEKGLALIEVQLMRTELARHWESLRQKRQEVAHLLERARRAG